MKLDLHSQLIEKIVLPKGDPDNETDYWNQCFMDTGEDVVKKAKKVGAEVWGLVNDQEQNMIEFVVRL